MRYPNEIYAFLGPRFDILIKCFCVAAQTRVRVHIFSLKGMLIEVLITILQCLLRSFVKYSNFVTVNYCDATAFEVVWLVYLWVITPIIMLKVSKAFAKARAFDLLILIYFGII